MAISLKPITSLLLPFFTTFYSSIVFTFTVAPACHHTGLECTHNYERRMKGNMILMIIVFSPRPRFTIQPHSLFFHTKSDAMAMDIGCRASEGM